MTLRASLKRLKDTARSIGRDGHALYLAARDPRVPCHLKALAAAIAAYALSPIDLIPDFIPVLGYLDEVILLPIAIAGVIRLIDPAIMSEHRHNAARAQDKPVSLVAAAAIVLIWTAAIAGTAGFLLSYVRN